MAGCTSESGVGPRVSSLVFVSGDNQQATVGATLTTPFVVRAQDQTGAALEGIQVSWTVTSGGGTITPSIATTGPDGRAQAILRLGSTLGSQTVTASIGGGSPVTFTATAVAAPPSQALPTGGEGQSAAVGATLSNPLRVRVNDAFGNAKSGVTVTFTVTAGGGTVSASSAVTGSNGEATTQWTLGPIAGLQTVSATVAGIAPVTFQATATAGAPAALLVLSGNNQTTSPGTPFPDSLVARVIDLFGNGVGGVTVTWTPRAGSGTVSPAASVSDPTGRVATQWTLGATGGPNRVTASAQGVTLAGLFDGTGLVSYATINAGERHTCGLSTSDVNYCWGYNGDGQLGIGLSPLGSGPVFAFPQPVAAVGNLTFRQAVGARFHTCALTLSGVGHCWGTNIDGRLGTNNVTATTTPTQVVTPTTFSTINPGRVHTCGLSLTNRAFCWGYTRDGQLGIGPVIVDSILIPIEVSGARNYKSLATGRSHNCAITTAGAPWCWGDNQSGQLGDGTTTLAFVPVASIGGLVFDSVTAGGAHTCALTPTGTAHCWGENGLGQLGLGNTTNALAPSAVSGGLVYTQISAGLNHTCGLSAGGVAFCWGDNSVGQLGDGTRTGSTAPTPVGGGILFRMINAGALSTCGISTAGVAYCWGDNKYGQVGDNTQVDRLVPTRVAFQP